VKRAQVKGRHLAFVAAVGLIVAHALQTSAAGDLPKLAVILVVDQMRADYVDRFKSDWSGGLKRLVTDGAWFRNAAYPYLTTVTCAGHATISTGVFPHKHGVIQNAWWDRDLGKAMTCTEDPNAHNAGYDVATGGGDSAYRLQVPTFADEMHSRRSAHVVAVALKDRSAIMLAGHAGESVTWQTNTLDGWQTSSAFGKPPAVVQTYLARNPITADFRKTWTRLLPESRYLGADDGVGEAPPRGWTRSFPHVLHGEADKPDRSFFAQWQMSPLADAYVGRFAAALVDSLQLGKHDGTDVLAVSFSSPDLIGHAFGPRSQEIQDTYAQLDRTIGALLDHLDTSVGRDQYVVAFTSDHGVTPIPEQLEAEAKDAGRMNGSAIVDAVEKRIKPALGEGKHVVRLNTNDLYFEPGVYARLQAAPATLDAAIAAIEAMPGVAKVFRSEELRRGAKARDPLLRAAALGYFPGRSGDLVLVPKPGWMLAASGTTHGSASEDDRRVPIVFMGKGVARGEYRQAATPADVAPTLAAFCGIAMPATEGRVLIKRKTVR
jgi:predicted AlkP superfamily pyrophosphatase or phosphodiesterase